MTCFTISITFTRFHIYPLSHTSLLTRSSLHSHLHLFIFYSCLSFQIADVNRHTHLHVSCQTIFLKSVNSDIINNDASYTRKYQDHVPRSFAYKVVCVDNKYSKKIVLYRGGNVDNKFIILTLNEYNYGRKITRKCFCKNLIMSAEENERFEMAHMANISWICGGLIENTNNKVRDRCHITGKYRDAAHYSCNIN